MTAKKIAKPTSESTFWTQLGKFKEILGIIIILGGFLVGYVTLLNDVKTLQVKVDENTVQLKKMNDILIDQQLLNGKIIQYMQMK